MIPDYLPVILERILVVFFPEVIDPVVLLVSSLEHVEHVVPRLLAAEKLDEKIELVLVDFPVVVDVDNPQNRDDLRVSRFDLALLKEGL